MRRKKPRRRVLDKRNGAGWIRWVVERVALPLAVVLINDFLVKR